MADQCGKCGTGFGFLFGKPRERCWGCGSEFCPNCTQQLPITVRQHQDIEDLFLSARRCIDCHLIIQAKIKEVKLTRAKSVLGRDIEKAMSSIATTYYESIERAELELRARAVFREDNCVLAYVLEKVTNWTPPKSEDDRIMEELAEDALRDLISRECGVELPELSDETTGFRVSGRSCSVSFNSPRSRPRPQPLQPLRYSASQEDPEHTGEALAYLLERRGLSVNELSAATNVELNVAVAIVEGKRLPSVSEAHAIAETFGVEVDDLFDLALLPAEP